MYGIELYQHSSLDLVDCLILFDEGTRDALLSGRQSQKGEENERQKIDLRLHCQLQTPLKFIQRVSLLHKGLRIAD